MTSDAHPQPEWRRSATHMLHAALMLKTAIEERLHAASGLFLADNEALLSISQADEPLRMSQIAERLALTRAGTTKVIDRLEELGYATRSPDPSDRRATTVTITPAGHTALTETQPIVDEALHDLWARHLTKTQLRAVLGAADRVMQANEGWL